MTSVPTRSVVYHESCSSTNIPVYPAALVDDAIEDLRHLAKTPRSVDVRAGVLRILSRLAADLQWDSPVDVPCGYEVDSVDVSTSDGFTYVWVCPVCGTTNEVEVDDVRFLAIDL